ncbi:hypothetical protein [Bdellovibrio svalbardensis]|uniref:Uncharacterized protein n=1 Tax=Bdellovibrio svalbardensis TaxID=2972972 RepID=A0ABT6DGR0_9BACT|nr:hypothetical protein [Bdellovibrio svalbardensis]MDG0815998.1 hypothetical protein [Bdellovibrio svalbardensis]
MKSLLFAIASLVTISTFAQPGGDIQITRLECKSVKNYADLSTTIKVLEGGLAGIPQIQVSHSTLVGVVTESYFAKKMTTERANDTLVYEGRGIQLSVNLTAQSPTEGTYPGTLMTQEGDQTPEYQEFNCTLLK